MAKFVSSLCQLPCSPGSFTQRPRRPVDRDLPPDNDPEVDNETLHPKHDWESEEYVPPHMWGLNIKDIDDFRLRVAEAFPRYQISEDDLHYRKEYNKEKVGPSVYTVTKGLIKKEAERTNGLSWALMRHEDGLECLAFASHAWVEGIYEFLRKLRRRWLAKVSGMYICFLSNPQIGVKRLLGLSIEDSPFHKALMHHAVTHVVVVPNRIESIYTRLWCAYEVYLAMHRANTRDLSIELAYGVPTTFLVEECLGGLAVAICGFSLSYLVVAPRFGTLLGPVMWLVTSFFLCLFISIVGRKVLKRVSHSHFVAKTEEDGEKWNFRTQLFLVYLELFVWALASGCSMRHLWPLITDRWGLDVEFLEDDVQFWEPRRHVKTIIDFRHSVFYRAYLEVGEEVPCVLLSIGMICVFFQHIFLVLIRQVIRRESHMLEFKGLRHADAANRIDKEKLQDKIHADIESAENLIEMLRGIGRYNKDIRMNVVNGLGWKQARDGISMLGKALTAIIAWQFWWMADLSGRHHVGVVLAFAALTCFVVVLLLFKFGDRAIFAVEVFFWMGLTFVIMSNWTCFWRERYVEGLKMSVSTRSLQIVMLAISIILCYLFYGQYLGPLLRSVHAKRGHAHQHNVELLRRPAGRQSMRALYEAIPNGDDDDP